MAPFADANHCSITSVDFSRQLRVNVACGPIVAGPSTLDGLLSRSMTTGPHASPTAASSTTTHVRLIGFCIIVCCRERPNASSRYFIHSIRRLNLQGRELARAAPWISEHSLRMNHVGHILGSSKKLSSANGSVSIMFLVGNIERLIECC